jgi:hypothetical protein
MNNIGSQEYFKGICPYTDKPCKSWLCYICSVEYTEERFARGDKDNV